MGWTLSPCYDTCAIGLVYIILSLSYKSMNSGIYYFCYQCPEVGAVIGDEVKNRAGYHVIRSHRSHNSAWESEKKLHSPANLLSKTFHSLILTIIMAWVYNMLFKAPSALTMKSLFIPTTFILVVTNYMCSHNCLGADWQKRGCQSALNSPPTTTWHSLTLMAMWVKCFAQGHKCVDRNACFFIARLKTLHIKENIN